MSNAVAIPTERRSLIADMAMRYNMEPKAFSDTLRATVVPKGATNEEFAAFLMVAKEYSLNPITKEIYAFPKQGGGIQPIVSVDGWANLINSHPQCDGFEFEDHLNDKGDLVSVTCRIYRKDRSRPTTATEYMVECKRDTSTWRQWPRRMLRHKALIQAARYAFGFAGIVDPDEAERFTTAPRMRDVTPREEPPAPPAETPAPTVIEAKAVEQTKADAPDGNKEPEAFMTWVDGELAKITVADQLETVWNDNIAPRVDVLFPPDQEDALGLYRKHEARLAP